MENAAIAEQLKLLSILLDIHGANPFSVKSYGAAAFAIEKLPYPLSQTPREKLLSIRGIGKSVAKAIEELLDTQKLSLLEEQLQNTPSGVVEMLQLKGLGPKKIHAIWKEMGIESVGELLYACQENRLLAYKGFGAKTQQSLIESIQFFLQHQGQILFAEADALYPAINSYLQQLFGPSNVAVTGAFRRQALTIEELEFVITHPIAHIKPKFITAHPPVLIEETEHTLLYELKNGLRLKIYSAEPPLEIQLFWTTGSPEFLEAFKALPVQNDAELAKASTEQGLFEAKGLPFIAACRRENEWILQQALQQPLPPLLETSSIKGLIHSHSTWSDGSNSLEEMARGCIEKGWEYMVISDHSQSASYANGLSPARVAAQQQELKQLNKILAPFKIYSSIESDILGDGSLDYEEEVLASFDLVIASVHSQFSMSEEKATARIIKAIENPFTRILGHPTGRLLLSRKGYPIDHNKIIDACASNGVVIELNAHPRRLDLDWQWIDRALTKGVLISINPDAHSTYGLEDVCYGILAAQKSGCTAEKNLSSFSRIAFEEWLLSKKTI
ncbi:MAG: helix-hairpin-helix domain-containing protein [Sphingomonadales bacterium]